MKWQTKIALWVGVNVGNGRLRVLTISCFKHTQILCGSLWNPTDLIISLIFHFFNQKSSILLYYLNNKMWSGNWIIISTKKLTLNPTCYGMKEQPGINSGWVTRYNWNALSWAPSSWISSYLQIISPSVYIFTLEPLPLPSFKLWRTRYKSVNYGISNYWST